MFLHEGAWNGRQLDLSRVPSRDANPFAHRAQVRPGPLAGSQPVPAQGAGRDLSGRRDLLPGRAFQAAGLHGSQPVAGHRPRRRERPGLGRGSWSGSRPAGGEAAGLAFAALVERARPHGPARPPGRAGQSSTTRRMPSRPPSSSWSRRPAGSWVRDSLVRLASPGRIPHGVLGPQGGDPTPEARAPGRGASDGRTSADRKKELGRKWNDCFTPRSTGSPSATVCRSCSAISRADRTSKRCGISVGRSGPSRAGFHGDGIGSVTGSAAVRLFCGPGAHGRRAQAQWPR